MTVGQNNKLGKRKAPGKHQARLAAVQALYQMEISDRGAAGVIQEFLAERFSENPEFPFEGEVDKAFFTRLVENVVRYQDQIDSVIRAQLSKQWRLSRVDRTLRAILRCGGCELLFGKNVPFAVVLDEYVEIAGDFFDKREVSFVNGTLDAIAKRQLTKEPQSGAVR